MKRYYYLLVVVCMFLLSISSPKAGFIEDGVPICTVPGIQSHSLIAECPGGGAIIVWLDESVTGGAIFAQKIDDFGRFQWPVSDVRVTASTSPQSDAAIIPDGSGGVFVTWQHDDDIYAQHLDAGGTPLWTEDGVPVCVIGGVQSHPDLCPGSDDGIIVCWEDDRSGGEGVYAQRLYGNGMPAWVAGGVALDTGDAGYYRSCICRDGQGGAIIAWEDSEIWAQRVRADGTLAWAAGGHFLWDNEFNHMMRGIEYDNRFGAIIFWEARTNFEAYVVARQHVDSTGTSRYGLKQSSWTEKPFNFFPCIVVRDDGGFILAYYEGLYGRVGSYEKDGGLLWMSNICGEGDIYNLCAATDSKKGVHLIWVDNRDGWKAYTQHIDSLGTRTWSTLGIPLAENSIRQSYPGICPDGVGGAIMAWTDYREGVDNADIYAGAIDCLGEPVATLLSGFDIRADISEVIVSWSLSMIDADAVFEARRCLKDGGSFVPMHGQVECNGMEFSFTDRSCKPGEIYSYRVLYSIDGISSLLFETDEVIIPCADMYLYQNIPNPFNPSTSITFSIPERHHVRITIHDVTGRLVAVVFDAVADAGESLVHWNGRDAGGNHVVSGIYFYRLVAGKNSITKKMTLLR
ncbi:MAG: T9SS type A sorting domain-containing protein [Bacteroidales bacterium]|nr:T9SS type A sorting domain-containing protein [Candidatus Latescibacterota bacterium]